MKRICFRDWATLSAPPNRTPTQPPQGPVARDKPQSSGAWSAALLCIVTAASGCSGGEDTKACLEPLPRAAQDECNLAHAATFDEIYQRTLSAGTCSTGNACHTPEGAAGGLVFTDGADRAYDALLGGDDHDGHDHAPGRVVPEDPECSELVRRLESEDTSYQMPPGQQLPATKRCAIIQWIADGADR